VWHHHWRLTRDPFPGPAEAFVSTSGHDEALARLAHAIESGQRLAVLCGGEGVGKSAVVRRAAAETRSPHRRFARVVRPLDGAGVFAGLAEGLGVRVPAAAGRTAAWKALADAVRLCRWQKIHPVLVVDDAHHLVGRADRLDLDRLTHVAPDPSARLTVVLVYGEPDGEDEPNSFPAWQPPIALPALIRSETVRYVAEKLAAAGRPEPAFTPPALGRLHERTGGVPRGIERLGSLALMAGAARGSGLVTPDLVDGAAGECLSPSRAGSPA